MARVRYSEKASKFCEIFTLLLTTVHTVKSKMKISQNFVAFSEYMNFAKSGILLSLTLWKSISSNRQFREGSYFVLRQLMLGPMKMSLFVKSSEKEEFLKILHNIHWYFVNKIVIVLVIEKNILLECRW